VRSSPAFSALAVLTAVSSWGLVAVGGVVRVSESGLGCPDWPLCDGRIAPAAAKEPILEYSHRATAAVAIVLLLATTICALRRYRDRLEIVVPLALAVVLVPVQALLGAAVVWLELPEHLVGVHFMVGMTMLGLCVFAAAACRRGPAPSRTYARTAYSLGGAGLLLVSLGAAVVSTDAMHACGQDWPACNGGLASGGRLAALQVAHRTAGYLVLALALILAVLALRARGHRIAGVTPACLAIAQIGFGIGIVLSSHGGPEHDLFRILHVAGAGALWASVVAVSAIALVEPAGATAPRSRSRASPSASTVGDASS
jgi:heme A synthase